MKFHPLSITWIIVFTITLKYVRGNDVKFLEDTVGENSMKIVLHNANQTQKGTDSLDWIGSGMKQYFRMYRDKKRKSYLSDKLTDSLKSGDFNGFLEVSNNKHDNVNNNVKIIQNPKSMIKDVDKQIYQYSDAIRFDDSNWKEFVQFAVKKVERLIKTINFKEMVPFWFTIDNKNTPRFLDEIADEIDVLENKEDTLFSRNRLRRLLIPMLILLKLFKLKLLLFLPFILGLVSFKKFLGFLLIVIPSLIGLFKIFTPINQVYTPPIYLPSGVGFPPGHHKETQGLNNDYGLHQLEPSEYHDQNRHDFDNSSFAQKLAYQGYQDYQN